MHSQGKRLPLNPKPQIPNNIIDTVSVRQEYSVDLAATAAVTVA